MGGSGKVIYYAVQPPGKTWNDMPQTFLASRKLLKSSGKVTFGDSYSEVDDSGTFIAVAFLPFDVDWDEDGNEIYRRFNSLEEYYEYAQADSDSHPKFSDLFTGRITEEEFWDTTANFDNYLSPAA